MTSRLNLFFALTLCLSALAACGGGNAPETATTSPEGATEEPAEVFAVDPAVAASISGSVSFSGEAPKLRPINMGGDDECKAGHDGPILPETVVVNANGTLKNAFVWVKSGLEGKSFALPSDPVTIDQVGCVYQPHVVGLQVGQTLRVLNSDPTLHNVHPLPNDNPEWNKSQAAGAGALTEQFGKPEVMIPVKCNIHPWMRAYVNVVDHPFFAVTGEDGSFQIEGLPPGDYTLEAAHERFGRQEVQVTVGAGEAQEADFDFEG